MGIRRVVSKEDIQMVLRMCAAGVHGEIVRVLFGIDKKDLALILAEAGIDADLDYVNYRGGVLIDDCLKTAIEFGLPEWEIAYRIPFHGGRISGIRAWASGRGIEIPECDADYVAACLSVPADRVSEQCISTREMLLLRGLPLPKRVVPPRKKKLVDGKCEPVAVSKHREMITNEQAWSKAVRERDGWCCFECGVDCSDTHGFLHAHHLLPKAKFPDSRNDINNGISLCVNCHGRVHARALNRQSMRRASEKKAGMGRKRLRRVVAVGLC